MKRTLLFLFALLFLCVPLSAREKRPHTGRILLAGLVVSPAPDTENSGLPDVLVEVVGTKSRVTTDKNGQFVFTEVPDGEVTVKFSKAGFQTVLRTAKVDSGQLVPATLTIELVPQGVTSEAGVLTGPGTVYVAYSRRQADQSSSDTGEPLHELDLLKRLPFQDPFEVVANPDGTSSDPARRIGNPISTKPNQVMLYPPTAPQRSTFLVMNEPPYHLAFDALGKYLYAAGADWITVFDESDHHEVVARIPIEPRTLVTSLSRSADGKWIFATLLSANPGILVMEAARATQVARLPLDLRGGKPTSAVSGPGGSILITVEQAGQNGSLLNVNPVTGQTLFSLPVGEGPLKSVVSKDLSKAYVVNSRSGSLTVVELGTAQVKGSLAVGVDPFDAVLTPDGKRLLVSNSGSDTISLIDTERDAMAGFVRVGQGPAGLAVSSDGGACYVANREGGNLSVVSLETLKLITTTDRLPFSSPVNVVMRP